MTERASRLSQSRCAAISRLFVRAMLSLCQCFSGSILALSVCFAATSPKGRGTGVPVRPTRDEQSFFYPETVVPCGLDSQQLDEVLLSRSRCPRKRGPLFCALSGLMRPAKSGPACQWLPLWGNGDDRRQRRKQGGAVGAAASRMQATAQQTLGAATRAVARRRRDGEVWFTMASRTKSKKRQIPKIPSKSTETFFERRVMDFPPSTAQIGYNSRRRGTGIGRARRGGETREKEAADLPSAPSRTSLCPAGGTFWRKRSAEHHYDPTRIY